MPDDTDRARHSGRAVDEGRPGHADESTGEDMRTTAQQEAVDKTAPEEPTPEPAKEVEAIDPEAPTPVPPADVDVVEPAIPERVRRPADVVRLVVALLLLVLGLVVADLAAGTRGAVEQDLTDVTLSLIHI